MMKKFSGFVILAAIFIAGARTLYNRRQANSFLLLADKKSLIDALNDDNPSTARFQQLLQDFEARLSEDYKTQNLGAIPSHHKTVNVLKEMLQALPPDAQTLQHWRDMLSQQERFEALAQKLLGADAQDLAASVASLAPDLAPQEPAGPIVRRYLELQKQLRQRQAAAFKHGIFVGRNGQPLAPASGLDAHSQIAAQLANMNPATVGSLLMDGQKTISGDVTPPPPQAMTPTPKHAASMAPQLARGAPTASAIDAEDPYLWLEPINSPRALDWSKQQSQLTLDALTKDARFKQLQDELRPIYTAKDRLVVPTLLGNWAYDFWQDETHVRGIWRRTTLQDFKKPQPHWETILDLDQLDKEEKENWVWHGADCLAPAYDRCLLELSPGGKDATVVREFDIPARAFVKDGFVVPEAKSDVSWADLNHLWVATDCGPGSMTSSGYPRIVKLWTRGTSLSEAKTIFSGSPDDVGSEGHTNFGPHGNVRVITRDESAYVGDQYIVGPDEKLERVPLPRSAHFSHEIFQGQALAVLREAWQLPSRTLPAGALISMPLDKIGRPHPEKSVQVVYMPDSHSAVCGITATKSRLYVEVLHDVKGQLLTATATPKGWKTRQVQFPDNGMASVAAADPFSDHVLTKYANFLTPATLYDVDASRPNAAPKAFRQAPKRFNAQGLTSEQRWATSTDGTKVPYFLIHRKNMKLDGNNPTLLYAYGGFEESMTPWYYGTGGKAWLEKGGVYVLANIRGGGEFGPKWHESAIKEHRQRAYDDFLAVSQDLISRKITSPRRLGIEGGSNGGLLVGVAFTQRPDLFNAVVCQVPLLDMMRYTHIGAGSSWIGEYGDPADPKMAEVIRKYSPYQNVKEGTRYPKVFFLTSTTDDRVEPAHARKMAAKLEAMGKPVLFFENTEGGHGAAAVLEESVKERALEYTYLFQQLVDGGKR